jgi:predicted nucleotidyltransferase component of viral defense system
MCFYQFSESFRYLALKGGTTLNKLYYPDRRFSKDLDYPAFSRKRLRLTAQESGRRDSNPRISAWKADALPLGDSRLTSMILP